MSILHTLASAVVGILSMVGLVTSPAPALPVGASVPLTPALIDTYLASGISTTDTSMTLANGTTKAGTALSGYICFVIDVNTPTTEYVCGNASSTSVTGLMRGIDVMNPNSTSSALAYSHRRFSSVQVSDYPTLQHIVRRVNGTDPFSGILSYEFGTSTGFNNDAQIVNKKYVDSVAYGTSTFWLSNGTNIYNGNTGNVGIGTTTPNYPLDIYGDTTTLPNGPYLLNLQTSATGNSFNSVGYQISYPFSTGGNLVFDNYLQNRAADGGNTPGLIFLAQDDNGYAEYSFQANQSFRIASSGMIFAPGSAVIGGASSTISSTNLNITGSNLTNNASTTFNATTTFNGAVILPNTQNQKLFFTSSTWTVPAGVTTIYVTMIGGGGGGGGFCSRFSSPDWTNSGGGSGASGEYLQDVATTTVPGQVLTVTIGNGGLGGLGVTGGATSNNGTKGATTTVGAISAHGGDPGHGWNTNCSADGVGGSAFSAATYQVAGVNGTKNTSGNVATAGANSAPFVTGPGSLGTAATGTVSVYSHGIGGSGGGGSGGEFNSGGPGSNGYAIIKW